MGEQTATMAMSIEGTIAGTLHYMSPEQLQGKKADARSDIFAFGLVLYEMLTGRRAFDGDNAASVISAIMTADPLPVRELQPVMPPALERILEQCLAKDRDERWQTAADVRRALDLVGAAPGAAQSVPSARRFRWWLPTAAFAAEALITGAAFRLAGPRLPEPWTFRTLTHFGRSYRHRILTCAARR